MSSEEGVKYSANAKRAEFGRIPIFGFMQRNESTAAEDRPGVLVGGAIEELAEERLEVAMARAIVAGCQATGGIQEEAR